MVHGRNKNIHIPINEINHSTNYQQFPKSFFFKFHHSPVLSKMGITFHFNGVLLNGAELFIEFSHMSLAGIVVASWSLTQEVTVRSLLMTNSFCPEIA